MALLPLQTRTSTGEWGNGPSAEPDPGDSVNHSSSRSCNAAALVVQQTSREARSNRVGTDRLMLSNIRPVTPTPTAL